MDTEPSLLILQWELKGKQGTTEPLLLRIEITQGRHLGRQAGVGGPLLRKRVHGQKSTKDMMTLNQACPGPGPECGVDRSDGGGENQCGPGSVRKLPLQGSPVEEAWA